MIDGKPRRVALQDPVGCRVRLCDRLVKVSRSHPAAPFRTEPIAR